MAVRKLKYRKRRQRGGINIRSLLKRGHDIVKKHKLASKALNTFGYHRAAKAADALGYGVRGKRRQRGGAWYNSLWNGIKKAANYVKDGVLNKKLLSKTLSIIPDSRAQAAARAASSVGLGRRRRPRRVVVRRAVRRPAVRRKRVRVVQAPLLGGSNLVNPRLLIY